ncbi:MAG: short-chain fatty acid transporter [Nitrospirae bacterium]|nr:short-chain fatty acid transporter [Nitrospirota bacterium]
MLPKLADALTRWSTRWVPDSFVIVFALTLVVFGLAKGLTPTPWLDLVRGWGDGLWALLSFSTQMCLIMISGHLLASTPLFNRALKTLAAMPRGPKSAILLISLTSMLLALANWGLSLIGSALLVREVSKHRKDTDYRLMVASAYLGLGAVWHAGLSGSAPLLVATADHFLVKQIGVIPITQTTLSPFNILLAVAVVGVLPIVGVLVHPKSPVPAPLGGTSPSAASHPGRPVGRGTAPSMAGIQPVAGRPNPPGAAPADGVVPDGSQISHLKSETAPRTPAERLDRSGLVIRTLAALGVVYLGVLFHARGLNAIDLNTVIMALLTVSLALHRDTRSFLAEAEEGSKAIWGVLIQFPLYSGIFGVIKASGLQEVLAHAFTAFSSPERFPFFTLVYSGVLNYIVPSGGAKFAIEAPYIMDAAHKLGVEYPRTVLAYAWGDTLTDIIQPFWAIPLLGFSRIEFREIMGYCLIYFFVYAPLVMTAFYFWG